MNLENYITDVPDFPKQGIVFKDITPLLQEPKALQYCNQKWLEYFSEQDFDAIAGMESRGFIFGASLATYLNKPFIPLRKPGKLPRDAYSVDYGLEYGKDTLQMHKDALKPGDKVLIIDDLLATAGTAVAATQLIEQAGAKVYGLGFLINLKFLNGESKLKNYNTHSLINYES